MSAIFFTDTILPKLMVQQSYACIWNNVRNQYEGIRKKKDSLLPSEELLPYLQNWEVALQRG